MKKLIIATLLGIVSVGAMGQVKKDTTPKIFIIGENPAFLKPISYSFAAGNTIWFQINPMPSFERTDSLILHVKRTKLRWINDSTAVIAK